jgi:hypothetical protein
MRKLSAVFVRHKKRQKAGIKRGETENKRRDPERHRNKEPH